MMTLSTEHYHRCKECRERIEQTCTEQWCAEGVRWVVLCLSCYERLVECGESEDELHDLRSRIESVLY